MKGSGKLILTGSLGDVMQESAQIAKSYIQANRETLDIPNLFSFAENDIHIHFPAGAVEKDGPSAGITMCICLISLLSRRKVKPDLAMTGELSLVGQVLPVGGIKEKILAAQLNGITTVMLPLANKSDVLSLPLEITKKMNLIYIGSVSDAIINAFDSNALSKIVNFVAKL